MVGTWSTNDEPSAATEMRTQAEHGCNDSCAYFCPSSPFVPLAVPNSESETHGIPVICIQPETLMP
eukprot:CAMPEP_0174359450 /NCGR_PEP_ID=MMETSP0811_2-20130205/48729_1 /TAXON_ID=73025 ORGANISM="Eutreptiella gymnastica-like, Strain CCMP1594" /NCGR_SAMPLE_ID=MMETSP0811_2 /ASSEMBLY_ACC=CAM_ASM_000667 /LENGTH=65 /DNA_ID=CAMNT_0015494169 /DNA_START=217 /DNA_END=410 /DNA_ORIENTATION=-